MEEVTTIVFRSKEEFVDFITKHDDNPLARMYNTVKKYDRHISIDSIFKGKYITHWSRQKLDKCFPDYDYSKEDKDLLMKFSTKKTNKCYAKYKDYELSGYFAKHFNPKSNPLYINERIPIKDVIERNDPILSLMFIVNERFYLQGRVGIQNNIQSIINSIPEFDIKKALIDYYEHEPKFYIQPVYKNFDKENLYTLCCDFKIPRFSFLYNILEHEGCPNCGVKNCMKQKDSVLVNLVIDTKDLIEPKECSFCKKKTVYFYMEDHERVYYCKSCPNVTWFNTTKDTDDAVFYDDTCILVPRFTSLDHVIDHVYL